MNKKAASILKTALSSGRHIQIKLLGDSITHGCGGTGFQQNGEHIVTKYSRNPDGFCWANLLKDALESKYSCTVVNNACAGTRIQFIQTHFDELVENEDDIILCAIGTNNRTQYSYWDTIMEREAYKEDCYQKIVALYEKFQEANKTVIFIANIPASKENEADTENYQRTLHMNDILELYERAEAAYHFPLIRLYTLFSEACREKGVEIDAMLKDGLHPNDDGHRLIYELLSGELGLN